jgi:probable FeS assembly SUF system protein SufT
MGISTEPVEFTRDCEVVQIPAGHKVKLVKGTKAVITQSLGGSYTLLVPSFGGLFRLAGSDADAIGKEVVITPHETMPKGPVKREELEQWVWEQLKTCYDPEIPVNIVDLGLVYDMNLSELPGSVYRVDVKMTLTAPGCGMGRAIAADAQAKISRLPGVQQASVEVVWNPPWNRDMISPEGKKKLGIV